MKNRRFLVFNSTEDLRENSFAEKDKSISVSMLSYTLKEMQVQKMKQRLQDIQIKRRNIIQSIHNRISKFKIRVPDSKIEIDNLYEDAKARSRKEKRLSTYSNIKYSQSFKWLQGKHFLNKKFTKYQ